MIEIIVAVMNMFRYPSFILQGSLDCYPIDAGFRILDTGSMYRSALSFNIKDRIPRSPLIRDLRFAPTGIIACRPPSLRIADGTLF